jgi:S1-C subfamily serine protease
MNEENPSPGSRKTFHRLQLETADFDRLAGLLAAMAEFRTETGRVTLLDDVFAGSPRRNDVLSLLDLGGAPRTAAVRTISRLSLFGQDEPGQETLGVLINKVLAYMGAGPDADFLKGLFTRYPLEGRPVATHELDAWRGPENPQEVQERIIGENTLRDVRMLELALTASESVVRIRTADSLGSGFLAGQGLIMTNNHVIESRPAAQPCAFQFNYQLDHVLKPAEVVTARTRPDGLFYTNPDLDVTVVEILDAPESVLPLSLALKRVIRDQRINIIQHPGGHYKKISFQNNFVAYADAQDLQYLTSTEPGSSGSPLFDNEFVVVGIHHSGGDLPEPGSGRRFLRNGGSSMIAVLADIQQKEPAIYERLKVG